METRVHHRQRKGGGLRSGEKSAGLRDGRAGTSEEEGKKVRLPGQ